MKSGLQKCIRRAETDLALRIAKTLARFHFKSFVRRIFVIAAEDVYLDSRCLTVLWMFRAYGLGWSPSQSHVNWLLGYVKSLCLEKSFVNYNFDDQLKEPSISPLQRGIICYLNSTDLMKGDSQMLTWYHNHPKVLIEKHIETETVDCNKILYIDKSNFPLHGVDFHTTPGLPNSVRNRLHEDLRYKLSESHIKGLIWRCRSSCNVRKPSIATHEDNIDYSFIENHVDDLSKIRIYAE